MNEDYITFETAKLAKKAGFRWPVEKAYHSKVRIDQYYGYQNQDKTYYSVCSQSVLAKWIREEFDLLIRCYFNEGTLKFEPCYVLINLKTGNEFGLSAKVITSISKREDEVGLCANFADGSYASLFDCEVGDFVVFNRLKSYQS